MSPALNKAPRLVISGASGYLGSRLVDVAVRRGIDVVVLGSSPGDIPVTPFAWRLGEPPPPDAFNGATAVIHLAHSWKSDELQDGVNLKGAEALFRAAVEANVPRFVFGSSMAARPDALNTYGRAKFAIEQRLTALSNDVTTDINAKIGFVYGGPEKGHYGLLCTLVRLTPVIPMIGSKMNIQPIHVDEVAEGLLKLAIDPPRRDGKHSFNVAIASPTPITFANWIKLLSKAQTGRESILIPVPTGLALLYCAVSSFIPFIPTINRERVLGLLNATPLDSASDIEALGIRVGDPGQRLGLQRFQRRQMLSEAAAMLSYVGGKRARSCLALRLLSRGIARDDSRPLGLHRLLLSFPALLRCFEPVGVNWKHALARRLHLAHLTVESLAVDLAPKRTSLLRLVREGFLEMGAFPLRIIFGRLYA